MEITLNTAVTFALTNAPYIAMGALTIAAIAAIYFYIQNRQLHALVDPAAARSIDDTIEAATNSVIDAFLEELMVEFARDEQVIQTFRERVKDISSPQAIQPTINKALDAALDQERSKQGLAELTAAFIKETYASYERATGRAKNNIYSFKPAQNFLKSGFEKIWEHTAASAEALLPVIPQEQTVIFKTAGAEVLKIKFAATEDLEEKRRLASDLEALGVEGNFAGECNALEAQLLRRSFDRFGASLEKKREIINQLITLGEHTEDLEKRLTESVMVEENWEFHTLYPDAVALCRDIKALLPLETISVSDIAGKVPEGLFTDALIQQIKNLVNDVERNKRIHEQTDAMIADIEQYKRLLAFGPVRDAFVALTQKIETQAAPSFTLEHHGEMERVIKTALWIDLLSLGAEMGHRELNTQMHSNSDGAIVAALH